MQILLENANYSIAYEPDIHCSYLNFLRNCNEQIMKDAYHDLIYFFEERGIERHITNTTCMGVISLDIQQWVSTEIVPIMIKRSLKKHLQLGLILGEDVFSNFGARSMAKKAEQMGGESLLINFFSQDYEAFDWMESNTIIIAS